MVFHEIAYFGDDRMKLIIENIITDMRRNGINITDQVFDMINEFIDIENSYITKITPAINKKLGEKTLLVVDSGDIIAVYNRGKFMYNPDKIKVGEFHDYDVYEITIQGTHVQNRREERRDNRFGLVPTKDAPYSNTPRSSQYIYGKDWDPEVNKVYYTKLLAQKHLGKYAQQLEDSYEVVKRLIDQRKERLTGKRSEYDRMITDISKQIMKIEDEMVATERDFSFDDTKLKKELSKLPGMIKKAELFLRSEEYEFKHSGKRKPLPYQKIEK